MGRRAKNKQGDPEPIVDANGAGARPSAKKLGKRKAEVEGDATSKRPAKKLKEEVRPKKGAADKKGMTAKEQKKKTKGPVLSQKAPQKKRKDESEESEEDDEDAEGASSAGWEDVEDDVKAEARCVPYSHLHSACSDAVQVLVP